MSRAVVGLLITSTLGYAGFIGAPVASASITIGNPLEATSFGDAPCGSSCTITERKTMLQTLSGTEAGSYASPISGTIVRWRIQTAEGSSPDTAIWLRVIRGVGGGEFTGEGTGPVELLSTEKATQTFPIDLPIKAGDYIGLDQDSTAHMHAYGARGSQSEEQIYEFTPPLGDGELQREGSVIRFNTHDSLLIDADVAELPTSSATLPANCAPSGATLVTVSTDPDPATPPKALHYRIDGGPETTIATTGDPGVAAIMVPTGTHTLEYWGEDGAGGQEAAHHTAQLLIGPCPLETPVPFGALGVAPRISSARLSASTFRAASHGASLARKRKVPTGTTISYRDSEAAITTVVVLSHVRGHRAGHSCKAGLARTHRESCTRLVSVGSFTHADAGDDVSVVFTGRVASRKLRPGRYTMQLTPRASGVVGNTASVPFRVVQ